MSDPATVAKNARESLSKGLQTLQTDPSIPPQLRNLAEPIARAMGALMQIERSNGTQLTPHAQAALEGTRTALSQLQMHGAQYPAVQRAMESVAASLGLVHTLGRLAGVAAPGAQPAAQARPAPAPAPQGYAPPVQSPPAYAQPQQAQAYAPPPQAAQNPAAQNYAARDPFAPPAGASPQPAAANGDTQIYNADLGAQSATNFYKGLSGNDIIDHGGLFVSTYMVPKIGTPIRLKVSLPGGYEFEANAVVRWSRESGRSDSADSPPGFGAQFTGITNEARQLVYRYVRNREPLFHDDL